MKKSLIALAALATVATAAQAQSSVTAYGIIDSGVAVMNNDTSSTSALSGGALATSRWGFKGVEDLGGGLQAAFNLEGGIYADNGAAVSTSTMFDRQSNISLISKDIGELRVGRTTRFDFDVVAAYADPFGAANFGGANAVVWTSLASKADWGGITTAAESSRYNNSLKFTSQRVAGFVVGYQHALGEAAGSASADRQQAYLIDYQAGNARLSYAYSRLNNTSANNGVKLSDISVLAGSYDFKVVKMFAGWAEKEKVGDADKVKATWVGATIPVNAKVNVMLNAAQIKNADYVANADAKVYALGATYDFSKRTAVYALAGRANNDSGAKVSLGTSVNLGSQVAAGLDQTGYVVGIRHSF